MAYIYEESETEGSRDAAEGGQESEKEKNSTMVRPILIYVIAENKQVIVLVSPICHHQYLSPS